MKYAFLVAWREYAESTKAKGFWIGIFLLPTILFFSIQVPVWLEKKGTPVRYFVLVDQSGAFAPLIQSSVEKDYQRRVFEALREYGRKHSDRNAATNLPAPPQSFELFVKEGGQAPFLERLRPRLRSDAPAFEPPRRAFQEVPLPAELNTVTNLEALSESLRPFLCGERRSRVEGREVDLAAAILIPREVESLVIRPGASAEAQGPRRQIQYWSSNPSETRLREEVERTVNAEVRRREYQARGLDAAAIQQIERTYAALASLNPKKEKGREQIGTADFVRQWAPSAFVYLLWVAIFSISQMLLNNTVEEKSNRIIEVLLSSVTPGELMMGKLFGIAAVGLTMVGAWIIALFGMLTYKSGGGAEITAQILTVLRTSNLVPLFTLYFLLGYLMYAAFILSIGSVCNSLKEAQSYMAVITTLMMVPLLTMTFIPRDPNGTLARVLSWIPVYTPFIMMNRAGASPPVVDLVGTLVLLVGSTAGALWMSAKVFRIGVLRTGQPPKLLEMIRWAVAKSGTHG